MSDDIETPALSRFSAAPQQERLWLLSPAEPGLRCSVAVRLPADCDLARLPDVLAAATRRHEALRTTFDVPSGLRLPEMVLHDELPMSWRVVEEAGSDVRSVVAAELARPLDLSGGPLVSAVLVRSADADLLVLAAPSLVADQYALATVASDVLAELAGSASADEPLQYADFAAWQRDQLTAGDASAQAGRDQWAAVANLPFTQLPFTRSRPGQAPYAPLGVEVAVPAEVRAGLVEAAGRWQVDESVLGLVAWQAFLARHSGAEAVTTALVADGRHGDELGGAVGAYARGLPITVVTGDDPTVAVLVDRTKRAVAEAMRWLDVAPLPHPRPDAPDALATGFLSAPAVSAGELLLSAGSPERFASALQWGPRPVLQIDPLALPAELAATLGARFGRLLESLASASDDDTVGSLAFAPQAELEEIGGYTRTPGAVIEPGRTIVDLIAKHVAEAPELPAVSGGGRSMTYGELDAAAGALAARLAAAGVVPGAVVGLLASRNVDAIAGIVGILRTGAAYLPLAADQPQARLAQQLEQAGSTLVVVEAAVADRLPTGVRTVPLTGEAEQAAATGATAATGAASTSDLAYVIFTSGSTGVPKGVGVTHANVVHYASGLLDRLGSSSHRRRFGLASSITTDLGNTSIFGALASGGCVHVFPSEAVLDADLLARDLAGQPLDVLKITPSHLAALLRQDAGPSLLPSEALLLGGEALSWSLLERVRQSGACRVFNHYGPTESTVGALMFDADAETAAATAWQPATVPVGRPMPGVAIQILDASGTQQPVGVAGELLIGGAGVAAGYVNDADVTDQKFPTGPQGRSYRTGDLARLLPGGIVEFLGRADRQVKVRGYRVEPAEIEAVLQQHPGVGQAAVIDLVGASGDTALAAYVVASGQAPAADVLLAFARERLPEHMVPSSVTTIPAIPLLASGKLDRAALPDPASQAASDAAYVAPRDADEESIAAIWAEVLGLERVSVEDDFFALGGHSLLGTQVLVRIRKTFGVDVPMYAMFTAPTVASLAGEVRALRGEFADVDEALLAELAAMSDDEARELLGQLGGQDILGGDNDEATGDA